jgi:hypothetical protein
LELCALPRDWWTAGLNQSTPKAACDILMSRLGLKREIDYTFLDRPEEENRNQRRADFRYVDKRAETIIAIEFCEFVHIAQREAASLRAAGRRFGPKAGMHPLESEGAQFGSVLIGDPDNEVRELREFIVGKISRRQLQLTEADERILLVLDTRRIYLEFVNSSNFSFAPAERDGIDHVFLVRPGAVGLELSPSKILQVW